jgi:hypothetical protein
VVIKGDFWSFLITPKSYKMKKIVMLLIVIIVFSITILISCKNSTVEKTISSPKAEGKPHIVILLEDHRYTEESFNWAVDQFDDFGSDTSRCLLIKEGAYWLNEDSTIIGEMEKVMQFPHDDHVVIFRVEHESTKRWKNLDDYWEKAKKVDSLNYFIIEVYKFILPYLEKQYGKYPGGVEQQKQWMRNFDYGFHDRFFLSYMQKTIQNKFGNKKMEWARQSIHFFYKNFEDEFYKKTESGIKAGKKLIIVNVGAKHNRLIYLLHELDSNITIQFMRGTSQVTTIISPWLLRCIDPSYTLNVDN